MIPNTSYDESIASIAAESPLPLSQDPSSPCRFTVSVRVLVCVKFIVVVSPPMCEIVSQHSPMDIDRFRGIDLSYG